MQKGVKVKKNTFTFSGPSKNMSFYLISDVSVLTGYKYKLIKNLLTLVLCCSLNG